MHRFLHADVGAVILREELGRHEEVRAVDAGILEDLADSVLIVVGVGGIDVAEACLDGLGRCSLTSAEDIWKMP